MRPQAAPTVIATAVTVAVSFLTVGVPGVGSAHPTAAAVDPSASSVLWAYGGLRNISPHGQGLLIGWTASATFGFGVVLSQQDSADGNYTLYANRTMGLILNAEFCRPNCAHPAAEASIYYHAWETVHAEVGLTPSATVTMDSSAVAALGLASSDLSVNVGIVASARVIDAGVLVGSRSLNVSISGSSASTLSPALGLLPLSLASGDSWSSVSGFTESGYALWKIVQNGAGTLALSPGDHNSSGRLSFNTSGSVSLAGEFTGTTIPLGGTPFDAVNLTITGPYRLREGFLLIPAGSDVFGSTSPSWLSSNSTTPAGSAVAAQSAVDVSPKLVGPSHLGFGASDLLWSAGASNPGISAIALPTVASRPGLAPAAAASPARAANATNVQGDPESVAQATTDQNCLATGSGCPLGGPRHLPLGLFVVAGAAAIVAVLLVAVVTERRRLPPPTYPNASLYPPGSPAGGSGTPTVRRPSSPAPAPEDDPLRHLW